MKSPRFSGRMLAVCLPGLATALLALPSRAIAPQSMLPSGHTVSICHQDLDQYSDSVFTPEVQEVRLAIQSGLAKDVLGSAAVAHLHTVLTTRYGEQLHESTRLAYALQWIEGQWVWICTSTTSFEVDFGARGAVVVMVTSTMDVPR